MSESMVMPGGWTMSVAWMRMPGQTWLGTALSFLVMWIVMMAAMMLPSLVPALLRYRRALALGGKKHLAFMTALIGTGYFSVWTAFGLFAFVLGIVVTRTEMQQPTLARFVPIGAGIVIVIAGVFQFTAWKSHHLACCCESPLLGNTIHASAGSAWNYGLRLGYHCSVCCAGLMAILLVVGIMNLVPMVMVAAVITVERLAPATAQVPRTAGIMVIAIGLFLIARATVLT